MHEQKYLEFAKKAEQEGYDQVVSLFRTAGAARDKSTARAGLPVINEMGGTPQSQDRAPTYQVDEAEFRRLGQQR